MKQDIFSTWCEEATQLIRYKPDRKTVYQELMDHLEDHRFLLMDQQDMDPEEAAQKALEAMGSAAEIAPQLAKIHRPFWGYVYSIVRAAAVFLCSLALLMLVCSAVSTAHSFLNRMEEPDYLSPNLEKDWQPVTRVRPWQTAYSDGYLFIASDAVLWELDGELVMAVYLDVIDFDLSMSSSYLFQLFWAVDSQGNIYGCDAETGWDGPRMEVGGGTGGGSRNSRCMMVQCMPSADIQWLELHYDRDGRDIVLHIDLTGGESQ